jgi:DNA-binding LacI/PurR family transcriptional regulator
MTQVAAKFANDASSFVGPLSSPFLKLCLQNSMPDTSSHTDNTTLGRAERSAQPSRVQMADIARLAGVSTSTVSRALAGSPLVNEATRTRVAELARSLNYTINVGAQNLRLKQNRAVAVVVPFDPQTRQHLSDPFFLSLIGSLADALTDRGHEMLLSRVDAARLDLAAQNYEAGRAAGIVLIGQWHHHDQLNEMAVRGVPFVVWGAQLPGQVYATVGSDNLQGGHLATTHLLAQGAKRVAFFGDAELPEIGLRQQGYMQALAEAGISVDRKLLRSAPFLADAIAREVERLCAEGTVFDAVFAASDLMAMTIVSTLRRLGRRVPDDVLVAGYDDIELARHFHPPLTTVRQPISAAGEVLVDQLLAQLGGARAQSQLLPTTLHVRESSQRR